MDELLEQFLVEGRDLVAQAGGDFDRLIREPDHAPTIDSAFRAIHTLKGSVAIFEMAAAERLLHASEDVLERARKASLALDRDVLADLVAGLDLVDRWIDELERNGKLPGDADQLAQAVILRFPNNDAADAASEASMDWLVALHEREHETIQAAPTALVAFRYAPDAQCFFRGEDPLAVAAGIPELVALSILPSRGDWPALDALEPFSCFSVIEGLSSAPIDDVRKAFRLVSDQASVLQIDPRAEHEIAEEMTGARSTVLRVDPVRLDALADGLGELIVAVNALAPLSERAARTDRALSADIRAVQADIHRVAAGVQRTVTSVRLVPIGPALRRLPRMAREIASGLDKAVAFSMAGEGTEVDKQVADGLFEPLLHLIRNAIDHGIEAPEVRLGAGKPADGRVHLDIRRDGDAVVITLVDDGKGIDPAKIRQAAVSHGLLPADSAEQLSDAAALRLIFMPGLSTATQVTEVSGRGVGMDAVQAAVEKLRGTIDVNSEPGEGSRFLLRLPVNALTTRLLIVEAGSDRFGVALDQIAETVRIDSDQLLPIGDGTAFVLRGKTIPVLSLPSLLGMQESPSPTAKLLVTRSGGERVAVRVDGFAERIDAPVRPPGRLLASLPGVTGSTLLGDGGVLLVLDLPELAA